MGYLKMGSNTNLLFYLTLVVLELLILARIHNYWLEDVLLLTQRVFSLNKASDPRPNTILSRNKMQIQNNSL